MSEGEDPDSKSQLPPTSYLAATDFPKGIAALANNGGGSIVYGLTETDKRATGRCGVELTEGH